VEIFAVVALVVGFIASVLGIAGYTARDAMRKLCAPRAESPVVERQAAHALPAVEPEPSRPSDFASPMLFIPSVNSAGAAVTVGAPIVRPIPPIKSMPGSIFSGLSASRFSLRDTVPTT